MNVLAIHTSVNADDSATREMVSTYLARLSAAHPDLSIVERDLAARPVPHITPELAPVQLGLSQGGASPAVALADTLIAELEAADVIVLGLPMYNFTVPSTFKAWLDHVIRAGRTFTYSGGAPKGLLPAGKAVTAFVASGGVYTRGPAQAMDFVEPYLRVVLGFIGLNDIAVIRAEAQALPDAREGARRQAFTQIEALAAERAAGVDVTP